MLVREWDLIPFTGKVLRGHCFYVIGPRHV